ncbi:hypothetical protein [Candidatus Liberibacter asiaticus]|uniref:CLIBASIA_04065 family virulence factor n=1 Tax=Liberibacter asiaticus TaxID=34021 RepID=UPI001571D8C3|nr:hypothetical protein [Candidatus Liberibacter asiaticus]
MFQNKNFLLGVLRLKKCTRGVFLVITAILLSSFVAIVDVVVDQVTVMQKKTIIQEVLDHVIYRTSPKNLYDLREAGRDNFIRHQIEKALNTYNSRDLSNIGSIESIVKDAVILTKNVNSLPLQFTVDIALSTTVQLRGSLLQMFSQSKGKVDISRRKKVMYKQNIGLMIMPFAWDGYWLASRGKVADSKVHPPKYLEYSHYYQQYLNRNTLVKNFLSQIPYKNFCMAPYHYSSILYWAVGTLTYSVDNKTTTREYYKDPYYATWDHFPYSFIKNVFDMTSNQFGDGQVLTNTNHCFPHGASQNKYMLMLAIGNQLSRSSVEKEKIEKVLQDCHYMHKRHRTGRDAITIFSVGFSPDQDTRYTLRQCASDPSKYYEINSDENVMPIAKSLARNVITNWFSQFTITVVDS